jgi:hypothetical protein
MMLSQWRMLKRPLLARTSQLPQMHHQVVATTPTLQLKVVASGTTKLAYNHVLDKAQLVDQITGENMCCAVEQWATRESGLMKFHIKTS